MAWLLSDGWSCLFVLISISVSIYLLIFSFVSFILCIFAAKFFNVEKKTTRTRKESNIALGSLIYSNVENKREQKKQ